MTSLPSYAPVSSRSAAAESSSTNNNNSNNPLSTSSSPSTTMTRKNPLEHSAVDDYFSVDRNVFYRASRDISLGDVAAAPMGTFDWGIVPEDFTEFDRTRYEMEELQAAAVLERHPCGEHLRALLNASRSLPVGIHQNVESKMSGSKGNFKRALEVASQAGGSGGASHSLLYSKGGPERRLNTAQMKWGPVKFSDMGTVALGAKITREVIELRRAFSKRDAIVTFPDHVTPEALAFTASRFGPNWEMFDIQKHADPDSAIMQVYMNKATSAASKKASLHGSESAMISYTKEGNPIWHRTPGDKALLTTAFRVAEFDDEPLIGPNGSDDRGYAGETIGSNNNNNNNNLAESNNLPLPPLPERPKGWPKEGPGSLPPSSQEGLRLKRFRLEDRVPAYKAVLDSDKARQAEAPPSVQVGARHLKELHAFDKDKKARTRLPVWRALKSPGKPLDDDEVEYLRNSQQQQQHQQESRGGGGNFSEFEPLSATSTTTTSTTTTTTSASPTTSTHRKTNAGIVQSHHEQISQPRLARERNGPLSPHRLHNSITTPSPKPEEGTYNKPLLLRSARIAEENQDSLAAVEKKRDSRGRIIAEDNPEHRIGETSVANTKALSMLLAPPPVPFSDVRRSHTAPMLPFMAVSGVPKFDAVTASDEQSTAWKDLLAQI